MTFFSIFDQQLQRGEPCSSRLLVANGFVIDRVCTASDFVCVGDFLNINLLGGLERRSYKQRKRETNNKHSRPNLGWGGVAGESLSPTPPPKKKKQNKTKRLPIGKPQNENVSWRRRAQIKQLAWQVAERQIGHRRSSLVLCAGFPVVKWRSRSVA